MGEKIVQFAWNSFQAPEDVARKIVLKLVDKTVSAACLRDSEVTNDEVSEIIDDAIKEIMEKHAHTGVVTEALAPLAVGLVPGLDSLEDSSTDGGDELSEHGSGLQSDCAGIEEKAGDVEGRLLEDIDNSSVDDKAGTTQDSAGSDEQEDQMDIAGQKTIICSYDILYNLCSLLCCWWLSMLLFVLHSYQDTGDRVRFIN